MDGAGGDNRKKYRGVELFKIGHHILFPIVTPSPFHFVEPYIYIYSIYSTCTLLFFI